MPARSTSSRSVFGMRPAATKTSVVDDVLARQAGDIWTGAANHRPFHDSGLLSRARQVPRKVFSRFSAANYEVLIVFDGHVKCPFRRSPSDGDAVAGRRHLLDTCLPRKLRISLAISSPFDSRAK